jgi:FtsZ-interacting cell division protein ZipA
MEMVEAIEIQTWLMLAAVVAVILVALGTWFYMRRKQSQKQSSKLRERFGPEYDRTVNQYDSRSKAESELKAREKRVERLDIVPLAPAEAARFTEAWGSLQNRFVDNPAWTVTEAEQLVRQLMQKRGYPMGDFERRAADISVDHPDVVANYRSAQAIASRDQRGTADTEELRRAVVHYRALFDELLEVRKPKEEVGEKAPLSEDQSPVH